MLLSCCLCYQNPLLLLDNDIKVETVPATQAVKSHESIHTPKMSARALCFRVKSGTLI